MSFAIIKTPRYRTTIKKILYVYMFLAVIISSCKENATDSSGYSKPFRPIFDSTNRLLELNQFNRALVYLDSSIKYIPLNTADKFRVYGFHFWVNNRIRHNNTQALTYADSMLQVIQHSPDKDYYLTYYGEANFAKGDALFDLNQYSAAYNSYYQGYLIGKNSVNTCTLSDYTYRMGMITYKQGNYKLAISYFKSSFTQRQQCKVEFASFYRQQEILDNIALCYKNQNKPDSALLYFNKATQYINDHGRQYPTRTEILNVAKAVIQGNTADILSARGQDTQAIELLKKSIATNLKKGNDNNDAVFSEIKLAQLYLKNKNDTALAPLLNTVRTQLDTIKSSDAETSWNLLMGNYYREKGDFAQALHYLETYHHIKDSLIEINHTLKDNNVSEQINKLENQYQLATLRNKQRIYIYAACVGLCLLFIIVLLVYRNGIRSKKEMAIVNTLNKQVNAQKDELENTLFDLENSSQEKDRILRTVAHDLRNPLGGVASLISAMVDDANYSPEQLELLKIIKETAFDSLELINEILEATDINPVELQKSPVEINLLLSNSVELMRFKAAEKNQKITLNTLGSPEYLLISREKIWRVISNLISNAIKFSPVGKDICVNVIDMKTDIQISIHDWGIGIPHHIKNKVFNMFTDAKRPGTLGEKSFGLGLSICRQIIEKHHGKIWFESTPQEGTTFYIRLSKTNTPASDVIPV
jgi:signal transduction histidine kinase